MNVEQAVMEVERKERRNSLADLDAWVAKPHKSRGAMLMRHRKEFRTLGIENPRAQLLGAGSFGAAYRVPLLGGSVIKLTRDPHEMVASYDLIGKATRHTVPVYGVWTLEDSYLGNGSEDDDLVAWHVVHRAYLTPLAPSEATIANLLFDLYFSKTFDLKLPQIHQRGMRSKWEEAIKGAIAQDGLNPQIFVKAMLMLAQIGVAVRELHEVGIDWADFHASNLMKDAAGVMRIADIGWGLLHEDSERETPFLTAETALEHVTRLGS